MKFKNKSVLLIKIIELSALCLHVSLDTIPLVVCVNVYIYFIPKVSPVLMLQHFLVRVRAKRLDESIDKLNRYCEALNLKKQQRNEFITNERSGGSNLPKMGAQMNRNSSDLMNQRLEDRTKTVVMNRRVRSSVTEIRVCIQKLLNCLLIYINFGLLDLTLWFDCIQVC